MPDTLDPELRLDLRIDTSAAPIAGSLGLPERAPVAFTGWAELAAALQSAVDGHTDGAAR